MFDWLRTKTPTGAADPAKRATALEIGALCFLVVIAVGFNGSLLYLENVRLPELDARDDALQGPLSDAFYALEYASQGERQQAVTRWLIQPDSLWLHTTIATRACFRYRLKTCTDEVVGRAIHRNWEQMYGGVLLSPIRALAHVCMGLAQDACPKGVRRFTPRGYEALFREHIDWQRRVYARFHAEHGSAALSSDG